MSHKSSRLLTRKFGAKVRELRKLSGLSQEELAFRSGLDRSFVGQVERGERNLNLNNIHKLAKGLAVRPGELLDAPAKNLGKRKT